MSAAVERGAAVPDGPSLPRLPEKACEMLTGIRGLVAKGKTVWLLDQFGVLHDGKKAYPAAIDAVRHLHEAGARLFIISNSSRRSKNTLKRLEQKGFNPRWFQGVMTSGEITHQKLSVARDLNAAGDEEDLGRPSSSSRAASSHENDGGDTSASDTEASDAEGGDASEAEEALLDSAFASLGDKVLHFTWSAKKGSSIPLDGLGLTTVTDPKEADFILAHGTEAVNGNGSGDAADEQRKEGAVDTPLDTMKEMLEEAAALGLPMIVANPDVVTVSGGGKNSLLPAPGTLKNMYEEMEGGGPILVMGKPAPIIYHKVLEMTGAGLEECVAVGDSMEHDIAGAMGAGCASVFVCAGIHATQLGMPHLSGPQVGDGSGVEPPDVDAVAKLAAQEGAYPDYAIPVFMW